MSTLKAVQKYACEQVIAEICALPWGALTQAEMTEVAWAYYFFSVQFRENLQLALVLYPEDGNLRSLDAEECNTDNLSPYPGVALPGEKLDHDEFMARLLRLSPVADTAKARFAEVGERYLATIRGMEEVPRAMSIASYENTGLERIFKAILRAPVYDDPLLNAFRFFLEEHIRFDSDPEQGHGALSRHMTSDDSIVPIWAAFKTLFIETTPALVRLPAPEKLHVLFDV